MPFPILLWAKPALYMPTRRVLRLIHLSCLLRPKRSRTLFWSKSLQDMVLAPPEVDKDEGRKTVQCKYPVRSSPTLGLHASLLVSHKYHSLQTSPLRRHLICSHFLFSCLWSPIMSHYQVKEDEPENPALWLLLRSQVTRQCRGCISHLAWTQGYALSQEQTLLAPHVH